MKCPLCLSNPTQPLYRGVKDFEHGVKGRWDFDRCGSCGLIFLSPAPAEEELRSSYPANYLAYSSKGLVSHLKNVQASLLMRSVLPCLPKKDARILELGCGGGHLLRQLKRRGYENLSGLDWNDALAPVFKQLGIKFEAGDIEKNELSGAFDCVILNNVIEHLLDPEKVLARIKVHLAPGGKILIRTPNSAALSHRTFSRWWAGLHTPRHVHIFSPESLQFLTSKVGFSSITIRYLADVSAWALSFQNYLYDQAATATQQNGMAQWPILLSMPLWVPATWVERVLKRTSSILAVLS